jgi:methionyl aminopeptidase
VPDTIVAPDYADGGIPTSELESRQQRSVPVRSPAQIAKLRRVCRAAREILDEGVRAVRAGATTDEIDRVVHDATLERGAYPSPLNYFHFPKSVCTSVNEVVCHGIPDSRELEESDIVNIDVTAYLDGVHGDLNETVAVSPSPAPADVALIKAASDALEAGIRVCRPGARYRDIGDAVAATARAAGVSVVRTYCGHGIGDLFHCAPNVPHYAGNKAVGTMAPGHVFTIEPMLNAGGWRDAMWPDGWTAVTADGSRSAQFEHTLVVTDGGCEVLTARLPESPAQCF